MNLFNVGPWELTVILIIAVLLLGPRRMLEVSRTIGSVTSQMRKLSNEFLGTIQSELQTTGRETSQVVGNIGRGELEPITSIRDELQTTEREIRHAMENIDQNESGAHVG